MIINNEVKSILEDSAFLTIVTMNPDGMPHPIIVGGGKIEGDSISVGVYAMKATQQNLKENDCAIILGAMKSESGAKGYRLTGNAKVENNSFIFTATKAEALI